MALILRYLMDFPQGYRIGDPLKNRLIHSSYILRALLSVSYLLGYSDLSEAIRMGRVSASSILPVIQCQGKWTILIPLYRPIIGYLRKPRGIYATPQALHTVLNTHKIGMSKVEPSQSTCMITIQSSSNSRPDNMLLRECERKRVVYLREGEDIVDCQISEVTTIDIYKNSIDRITNAANPYSFAYNRVNGPLGLIFWVEKTELVDSLNKAVETLGFLGLGKRRNVGFGNYTLLESETLEESSYFRPWDGLNRNNIFLAGDLLLDAKLISIVDWENSRLEIDRVSGYIGSNVNLCLMPEIHRALPGSKLALKGTGKLIVEDLNNICPKEFPQILASNPVVIT